MKVRPHPPLLMIFLILAIFTLLISQPPDPASSQILPTFQFTLVFPTPTRTPTPVSIGNFVWDDLNGNGIQNVGEPGLSGITVQLWNPSKTQLIASDVTDANGIYTLVAPQYGDYRVRAVLPNMLASFSPKDQGADDTKDSDINPSGADLGFTDTFTIASNVISITLYDVGIIIYRTPTPTRTPTPKSLGNFVWHDINQNGNQDASEPGVPGIMVQLWNSAKTQLVHSTTTNANGNYTLIAPTEGDYRIRAVLPNGLASFSPKDVGVDDNHDSDINPSGANLGFTDVLTIASNIISISNIDMGLYNIVLTTPTPPASQQLKLYLPLVTR